MDFGEMNSQEDVALAEGKPLSAFGQPAYTGESYEDSFNHIIPAAQDNGDSVILTVYGMGLSAFSVCAARIDLFLGKPGPRFTFYIVFLLIQMENLV